MAKIIFIATGGTIDKDYPHTTKGWAFEFGTPAIERLLEKLKPSFEWEIQIPFQKDSLEIDDTDRALLVEFIKGIEARAFIITHGTDTLIETGLFLQQQLDDQLVILTGAMLPERFYNSEAPINLGSAIGAAQVLDKGIWAAMHGIVKPVDVMQRNMETGKFW